MQNDSTLLQGELSFSDNSDDFSCAQELGKKILKCSERTGLICCPRVRRRGRQTLTAQRRLQLHVGYLVLMAIGFMGMFLFYFHQAQKNNQVTERKNRGVMLLEEMRKKREEGKMQLSLNFSRMGVRGVRIRVGQEEGVGVWEGRNRSIKSLDLGSNRLESFSGNEIQELETLILNGNPLVEIQNNSLPSLRHLQFGQENLLRFNGNHLPLLQTLSIQNLVFEQFTGNALQNLTDLAIPATLQYFNQNLITQVQAFEMLNYSSLREIRNNSFRIKHLRLSTPHLSLLESNRFVGLQSVFIEDSKITSLQLDGNPDLESIIISAGSPVSSLILRNNPKLSNIQFQGETIQNLVIVGSNITSLQSGRLRFDNVKSLFIEDINLVSLDLSNTTQLENLHISDRSFQSLTLPTLSCLQSLHLQNTGVQTISNHSFLNLTHLTLINNTHLQSISNNSFDILQSLIFKDSDVVECENNIFNEVERIVLEDKRIAPSFLEQIKKERVKELTLIGNNLQSYEFSEFQNLESLVIINNPIQYIELVELKRLTNLTLNLTNLKYLLIETTNISNLTGVFAGSLIEMDICRSPIVFFENFTSHSLKKIRINDSKLISFRDNWFPSLQVLEIKNSGLETLILDSKNSLRRLELVNTSITQLTQENHQFEQLKKLILRRNHKLELIDYPTLPNLKELELGDLPNLRKLHLSNTNFEDLNNLSLNLTSLELINNSHLTQFNGNSFPSLQNLKLENLGISDLTFDNPIPDLFTLTLKNLSLARIPYLGPSVSVINIDNIGLTKLEIPPEYKQILTMTLQNEQLDYIVLEDVMNLKHLQLNLPELKHVCIINSPIDEIYFGGSVNMETLWLENTRIYKFRDVALPELLEFTIIGTSTASIYNLNFPKLNKLEIEGNITQLDLPVMDSLTHFSLISTHLLKLPPCDLYPNLQTAIIKNNSHTGTLQLQNLQKLTHLTLQGDFFEVSITNTSLSSLRNLNLRSLRIFTLSNNPILFILSNNTLPHITKLTVQNTMIFQIDNSFFETLEQLVVKKSFFCTIDALFNPENIIKMIIEDMDPDSFINPDVYPSITHLQIIRNQYNNIIDIKNLPKLQFIRLTPSQDDLKLFMTNLPLSWGLEINNERMQDLRIRNCNITKLQLNTHVMTIQLENTLITEFKYTSDSLSFFTIEEKNLVNLELVSRKLERVSISLEKGKVVKINAPLEMFTHNLSKLEILHLNNTMLSEIKINRSPNLRELVYVTGSKKLGVVEIWNTKITTLETSKFNPLTSLILINNPIATLPNFDQTNLATLKLVGSPQLKLRLKQTFKYITCLILYDLQVETVNISTPSLTYIQLNLPSLKYLSLNCDQLTLDMTKILIPNIIKFNFMNIAVSNWVDISSPNITDLTLINTTITQFTLKSEDAKLKNIIITGNPNLTKLQLNLHPANQITIKQNSIKRLFLTNYNQEIIDIEQYGIESLSFVDSGFTSLILQQYTKIRDITLQNCENLNTIIVSKDSAIQELHLENLNNLCIVSFGWMSQMRNIKLIDVPLLQFNTYVFPYLVSLKLQNTPLFDITLFHIPQIETISIDRNQIAPIINCNYSKLKSLEIRDSHIQSIGKNCLFESLTYFEILDTDVMEIDFSSIPNVQRIMVLGINIPTVRNISLPFLRTFRLGSSELTEFKDNYLPSMTNLSILYSPALSQLDLASSLYTLQYLDLQHVAVDFSINTKQYKSLENLNLIQTKTNKIIVNPPLKDLRVKGRTPDESVDIEIEDQSSLRLLGLVNLRLEHNINQKLKELTTLSIENTVLPETFFNTSFPGLFDLKIIHCQLKSFAGNSYPKLKALQLTNTSLKQFSNNELPELKVLSIDQNPIEIFDSYLPSLKTLIFKSNLIETLPPNFFTNIPNIYDARFSHNLNLRVFSGFTSPTLTMIDLSFCAQLSQMDNNSFESLVQLEGSNMGLVSFNNNNFPNLAMLYLNQNPLFPQYLVLAAVANLKNQGDNIKLISLIGIPIQEEIRTALCAINKDATVIF